MSKTWEEVDKDGYTKRLRVDGGWIYLYATRHQGVAMCFVPNQVYSPIIPYNTSGQGAPAHVN